jgi:hypothetical protein
MNNIWSDSSTSWEWDLKFNIFGRKLTEAKIDWEQAKWGEYGELQLIYIFFTDQISAFSFVMFHITRITASVKVFAWYRLYLGLSKLVRDLGQLNC